MKKAVIIGATSGMGYDLTIQLISQGWKVGIAGRSTTKLQAIQKQYGIEKVVYETIDVTSEDAVTLLAHLIEQLGGMDTYLHFSAVGYQNPELDPKIENYIIQTNIVGFTKMVDYAYNWFKNSDRFDKKHKGHIVVISSMTATKGMGISTSYSSSKRFQSTYVQALSQLAHLHHDPVQFTEIRPGFVATPMLKHPYPCQMSRKTACRLIMRAVKKKRRLHIFDWRYRFVSFIWQLLPNWLWERMTFIR